MLKFKKLNIKDSYNYRGFVTELLASLYIEFPQFKKHYLRVMPKKYKEFLDKHWHIDLWEYSDNKLTIYEVKSKNFESKNKFDMTESVVKTFDEAKLLGIETKLLIIYYKDNWELEFKILNYSKHLIKIHR